MCFQQGAIQEYRMGTYRNTGESNATRRNGLGFSQIWDPLFGFRV